VHQHPAKGGGRIGIELRTAAALDFTDRSWLGGWFPDGVSVALRAFDFMMDRAQAPDGAGGFVQLLTPDGGVRDPTRDTYDHAFILLALAWLARACGDSQVMDALIATLDFVEERLALPDGTFRESWPERGGHRQNPHMHMFEAMLALHETVALPGALERAQTICDLLETHFIERESDTLCEHFSESWQPADGAAGRSREPGHAAEWTWLLRKHERLAHKPNGRRAAVLLEGAIRLACPNTGLLVDEVDRAGAIVRDTRRCWPQTELAKAWLAEAEIGRVGAAERARRVLVHLADDYVGRPLRGTWTDCFAADGAPACDHIPASTLYHLFCATAEAARVLGEPAGNARPAIREARRAV